VDGTQLALPGLILTNNTPVNAGFGTHGIGFDNANGLVLLENLNYIRSYNRADPDTIPGVVVNITNFDGPRPVTVWEPIWKEPTMLIPPICNSTEDGTRMDRIDENGEMVPHLYLPNGRRTTGVVVTPSMCSVTYNDSGRTELDDPLPGVYMLFTTDAVGAHSPYLRIDPLAPMQTPWDGASSGSVEAAPIHELKCIMTNHGGGGDMTTDPARDGGGGGSSPTPNSISAISNGAAAGVDIESQFSNTNIGQCTCREGCPNCMLVSAGRTDPTTGLLIDQINGNGWDSTNGIMLCGGGGTIWAKEHFEVKKNGDVHFTVGGSVYKLKDTAKDKDDLYNVDRSNLDLIDGDDYLAPSGNSEIEDWLSEIGAFGGTGGCVDKDRDDAALETASYVFDILGFVPVVGELADIASTGIAAIQGDVVSVALSLVSMLPLAGDIIAKPIKWAWKAGKKIAWGKFFDLVTKHLGDCVDAGLKGKIQKALRDLRDHLNKNHNMNLPEGWCFTAGTVVATDEEDKPIEEIDVGDRVLTPETLDDLYTHTDVNPATWRLIVLELPNPNCAWDIIRLRLLRPLDWLNRHRLRDRKHIRLNIDELGLLGLARILAIERCPTIRPGRGRVVTGTITHFNAFVKQLWFAGSDEPLQPTDVHPFFSADRNAWVRADSLRDGERVITSTTSAVVQHVDNLAGIHRVYNLEVEDEHCYFVGRSRLLVHNGCSEEILDQLKGTINNLPGNADDLAKNGFKEVTHPNAAKVGIRKFEDAHGNQIEFHKGTPGAKGFKGKDHYHVKNPNATGKHDAYLDKDGNPVADNSKASHIMPN
jgi:hypothetical protein